MDIVHRFTKWVDHNRGAFVSFVIMAAMGGMLVFMIGCESTTTGLADGNKVDRQELEGQAIDFENDFDGRQAEIQMMIDRLNSDKLALNKKIDAAVADLDKQDKFKAEIVDLVGVSLGQLAEGAFNPASLILPAVGLCGVAYGGGKSFDNKRKDKIIKKNGNTTT
jgi:hypothetical protein